MSQHTTSLLGIFIVESKCHYRNCLSPIIFSSLESTGTENLILNSWSLVFLEYQSLISGCSINNCWTSNTTINLNINRSTHLKAVIYYFNLIYLLGISKTDMVCVVIYNLLRQSTQVNKEFLIVVALWSKQTLVTIGNQGSTFK